MLRHIYKSPLGSIILISHQGEIVYCNWDSEECSLKETAILKHCNNQVSEKDSLLILEAVEQLDSYFFSKSDKFDLPIKLIGSHFQQKVWNALKLIKYGETVSYKELAETIGRPSAVRAVANACGKNPVAIIIPCHRVVSSSGNLGGYTGGIEKKKALLKIEKINECL